MLSVVLHFINNSSTVHFQAILSAIEIDTFMAQLFFLLISFGIIPK